MINWFKTVYFGQKRELLKRRKQDNSSLVGDSARIMPINFVSCDRNGMLLTILLKTIILINQVENV
jgi:hypothetical protein